MAGGEATQGGDIGTRPPTDARTRLRIGLGLVAILVIVLAGLALLNSFYVEYAPGEPDPDPGGGEEGAPAPGDLEPLECDRFAAILFWTFVGLSTLAAGLFTVAVARRGVNEGRIGSSIWGILSVVTTFVAILALGGWRIMEAICAGALNCENANDGTYTSFLGLLALTLVALGIGIALAHAQRRNFLTTGWGLLGLLVYLPTVLTGFTWFLIRTLCTPDLSCATRDQFLADLALLFWFALLGAAVAAAIGIYVQRRHDHGVFRSGWGVVAILLVVLAALAGSGWLVVDGLVIPGCDPIDIEEPVLRTCEEVRDHLQGRIGMAFLAVAGVTGLAALGGLVFEREDPKRFWSSAWAIVVYVGAALLVLIGIAYLLAGTMCDEGDPEDRDDGETPGGGGDGQGGDGDGPDSGNGDGGPGTGGPTSGDGGGGGGSGDANPQFTPVEIDPASLTWVLVAILVVIGIAALLVLLRYRRVQQDAALAAPAGAKTDAAREAERLMALLDQGKLTSDAAVIAAYREFVSWSSARGWSPHPDETPREHAARVAAKIALPADALAGLVAAYEVARLSPRKPNADEETRAVDFARRLRREGAAKADPVNKEGPR